MSIPACTVFWKRITFGFSITNFAFADGCTVQLAPIVYTGDGQAVCDAIIARCPLAVGVVVSSTIRIWKLRYSLAITQASHQVTCPVIVFAVFAVACRQLYSPLLYVAVPTKNPSPDLLSNGTYFSSSTIPDDDVAVVTPIAPAFQNTHCATQKYLDCVAAVVVIPII